MSFYGVGFNDRKYATQVSGKMVREYSVWKGMLKRCYGKTDEKAYRGCYVSENFKSYSYFYEWCQLQYGFNNPGWQLDKDILIYGNKMYGEDTCIFIPNELNALFTGYGCEVYDLPIGVTYHKDTGKFQVVVRINGKNKYIGLFVNKDDAVNAYMREKTIVVNHLCNKYKGELSEDILNALMGRVEKLNA